MMIYPPITELVEKTGSRYTLVLEAAKRARQLSEGAAPLVESDSGKEVTIATDEIYENKLHVFPVAGVDVTDEAPTAEISDSAEAAQED